jgi:lipopolysaccharide heptosyltransferase I
MINGVPRILIIRLSSIGDVVRVLPALHALRDLYPDAQIDWAIEPKSRDIVEGHPELDGVLVFERQEKFMESASAFRQLCKQVRAARYDIVVDFHGIIKSGLIMRASRAPKRYGFTPPRSQDMSHLFANERVKLVSDRMNRIEENIALCNALGAKRHTLDVTIDVSDDARDQVAEYFTETFRGAKRVVTLHVAVDRVEKQWPLEHFAKLADMLLADGRFEVLLTWGPGQKEMADEVLKRCDRNPMVAPETPDLKHYAALAEHADLYCGGDTGPMHIASAMGTPVVAIFGGTDPYRHGPLRTPSRVLFSGNEDEPNPSDKKTAEAFLGAITPEMAYDACVGLSMEQGAAAAGS